MTIDDLSPRATIDVDVAASICSLFLGDGHIVQLGERLGVLAGGTIIEGDITFKGNGSFETAFLRVYSFAEDTVIHYDGNPNDNANSFRTNPPYPCD